MSINVVNCLDQWLAWKGNRDFDPSLLRIHPFSIRCNMGSYWSHYVLQLVGVRHLQDVLWKSRLPTWFHSIFFLILIRWYAMISNDERDSMPSELAFESFQADGAEGLACWKSFSRAIFCSWRTMLWHLEANLQETCRNNKALLMYCVVTVTSPFALLLGYFTLIPSPCCIRRRVKKPIHALTYPIGGYAYGVFIVCIATWFVCICTHDYYGWGHWKCWSTVIDSKHHFVLLANMSMKNMSLESRDSICTLNMIWYGCKGFVPTATAKEIRWRRDRARGGPLGWVGAASSVTCILAPFGVQRCFMKFNEARKALYIKLILYHIM